MVLRYVAERMTTKRGEMSESNPFIGFVVKTRASFSSRVNVFTFTSLLFCNQLFSLSVHNVCLYEKVYLLLFTYAFKL